MAFVAIIQTSETHFDGERVPGAGSAMAELMHSAGQRLREARERLNLRFRDVEEASVRIADQHKNDEYLVYISRLNDIENKGTVPTLYRLYTLCVIYRLDMAEVLEWYGVDIGALPGDASQ